LLNHAFRALAAQTEAPRARFMMPPPAKKACHARPRSRCDVSLPVGHPQRFDLAHLPAADYTEPISAYEEMFRLLRYCSIDDEEYYSALVRMFEQALIYLLILPEPERVLLMARLDQVRAAGQKLSWGVDYDFDALWEQTGHST
jgi:hypothetical protein